MSKFQSFSILNGQIICGSYPYDANTQIGDRIITSLLENGITVFIDLTEIGERTTEGKPLLSYYEAIHSKTKYLKFSINEYDYKINLKQISTR